ncbi:hypothetical protein GY524_000520 [Escherichia coli]|nr:hypothetical protein [Escherichia coli]EFI3620197.1 hypothetical protein [Escherichia coli]EFI3677613.1 hypothetical protein [Escherichia coli]EFI3682691.1 hypothetical protein [Escherichia coli]EFI3693169.1 hypothetical protein [Escherichia coli]
MSYKAEISFGWQLKIKRDEAKTARLTLILFWSLANTTQSFRITNKGINPPRQY